MKKRIFLCMITVMLFIMPMSACTKNETPKEEQGTKVELTTPDDQNQQQEESRNVTLDDIGLIYDTPDTWRKYEATNIYPTTITSEGVLARIKYNFISEKDLPLLSADTPASTLAEALTPMCEIVVLPKANDAKTEVLKIFRQYENAEFAASNDLNSGTYVYYLCYGYKGDMSDLSESDKAIYDEIVAAAPEIIDTIITYNFDPEALERKTNALNNTITFSTKTIQGEDIDSRIFAENVFTMVTFDATYGLTDEAPVMQETYELIKKKYPDVGLLVGYIDTPEEKANETALQCLEAAGSEYPAIMMDRTLATWVTNNLEGIPTTVFVDSDGQILGEPIKGAKDPNVYMDVIEQIYGAYESALKEAGVSK